MTQDAVRSAVRQWRRIYGTFPAFDADGEALVILRRMDAWAKGY